MQIDRSDLFQGTALSAFALGAGVSAAGFAAMEYSSHTRRGAPVKASDMAIGVVGLGAAIWGFRTLQRIRFEHENRNMLEDLGCFAVADVRRIGAQTGAQAARDARLADHEMKQAKVKAKLVVLGLGALAAGYFVSRQLV